MKRYFTVVEEVRIEYEHRTTPEEDAEIETKFNGNYENWLKSKTNVEIWGAQVPPEHHQIINYINMAWSTVEG